MNIPENSVQTIFNVINAMAEVFYSFYYLIKLYQVKVVSLWTRSSCIVQFIEVTGQTIGNLRSENAYKYEYLEILMVISDLSLYIIIISLYLNYLVFLDFMINIILS